MRRIFIADENLPPRLVDILKACFKDVEATPLTRLYATGTKDPVWIPDVARRRPKPVILTCDGKIPLQALKESTLSFIVFSASWMTLSDFSEKVWRLLKLWPRLAAILPDDDETQVLLSVDIRTGAIAPLEDERSKKRESRVPRRKRPARHKGHVKKLTTAAL